MPKVTIDDKVFDVEAGTTVLNAARSNGIEIPHFCWHPALSISGNCRMCLVEIENMPKLMIACQTVVTDNMVVSTNSEKVIKARQAVMEFLLINHPLDCPICDEAGQCRLQNYTMEYSLGNSRFEEIKNEKQKRHKIGPFIFYDAERCISCSRCIRFCNEVAKTPQITFVNRGDRVLVQTFSGQLLDNPYSMNTVDICPVGALTSADFRFKARVWEMSFTDSICVGCSRGCNIKIGVRNNEILRLEPRENLNVNKYWMCDNGRLNIYKHIENDSRITHPLVKKDETLKMAGWDEAVAQVVSFLTNYLPDEIYALGSAYSSVEDNYMLKKLFINTLKIPQINYIPHIDTNNEDSILIRADKTPNQRGLEELNIKPITEGDNLSNIIKLIKGKKIKLLYVMDDDLFSLPQLAKVLDNLDVIITQSSHENKTAEIASIILPCSTSAEVNGTFVNFEGRIQRVFPALSSLDRERTKEYYQLSRLDKFGTDSDKWNLPMKIDARPSWRILAKILKLFGVTTQYSIAKDVFNEIVNVVPAFEGLSYNVLSNQGALLKNKK
jgi:NADH-quinone oxidoreductase subunit G